MKKGVSKVALHELARRGCSSQCAARTEAGRPELKKHPALHLTCWFRKSTQKRFCKLAVFVKLLKRVRTFEQTYNCGACLLGRFGERPSDYFETQSTCLKTGWNCCWAAFGQQNLAIDATRRANFHVRPRLFRKRGCFQTVFAVTLQCIWF